MTREVISNKELSNKQPSNKQPSIQAYALSKQACKHNVTSNKHGCKRIEGYA
jgi:acyl-CoA-binding protein